MKVWDHNACKAEIESLRQQLDHIKQVEFPRKVEAVASGWKTKLAAQKEHSKEQFEKLLRWVDDYCEVSDTDFEQIEPVVQSVLGEALEATPLADLRQQLAACERQSADSQKQSIEDSENILRLIETIKYLQGIAVRGSGIDQSDDQTVEQFVLSYVKGLEQQLSAALAACKVKDAALKELRRAIGDHYAPNDCYATGPVTGNDYRDLVECPACSASAHYDEALSIQPDDAALKTWLGEPIGEVKKHTGSLKDMAIIVWSGEQPEEGAQLYIKPKGLK